MGAILAVLAAATALGLTRLEVDTAIGSLLPTGDAAVTEWDRPRRPSAPTPWWC